LKTRGTRLGKTREIPLGTNVETRREYGGGEGVDYSRKTSVRSRQDQVDTEGNQQADIRIGD
jgi:hypothetical protein